MGGPLDGGRSATTGGVVVGERSAGLSSVWSGAGLTAIQLPMRGAADSLNVSATAAILF